MAARFQGIALHGNAHDDDPFWHTFYTFFLLNKSKQNNLKIKEKENSVFLRRCGCACRRRARGGLLLRDLCKGLADVLVAGQLAVDQLAVQAALQLHQLVVAAELDNGPAREHGDRVGVLDGRQTMGDDEHGAVLHGLVDGIL